MLIRMFVLVILKDDCLDSYYLVSLYEMMTKHQADVSIDRYRIANEKGLKNSIKTKG